jgi:hypothetical protein
MGCRTAPVVVLKIGIAPYGVLSARLMIVKVPIIVKPRSAALRADRACSAATSGATTTNDSATRPPRHFVAAKRQLGLF